jgi:putative two-component system response regulator
MKNGRPTVFLVDDNITNLTTGKNMLKDHYDVFPITSGIRLFSMLEKVRPDLILLDVEMPEMSGYEAIKKLKADVGARDIPVIFLSAGTDSGAEREGLSLGALDYILKPFSPPLLLGRLEKLFFTGDRQGAPEGLEYLAG